VNQPVLAELHTFSGLKYINSPQNALQNCDVFYSQYSHQHVSAGIPAIFRVMFLSQTIKLWLTMSPTLNFNFNQKYIILIIME